MLPPCQSPNTAPAGSMATAIRPSSMTSIGSASTWPPAPLILAAVASTSSVARYVVQADGASGAPILGLTAATIRPPEWAIE